MLLVRSTVPLRLLLIGFVGFWVKYICRANTAAPGQITPNGALAFKREKTKERKKKKAAWKLEECVVCALAK